MTQDCLFCKIIEGKIPSKKVYENDFVFAFEDINPQAPVHTLIVPKKHIPTLNEINQDFEPYLSAMFAAAKEIAAKNGLSDRGYRTVFNVNKEAGQVVFHLHLHLLGGREFKWPPG
ncbi:MAG: histidine triad nucleotide-binding protein [Candidatus Goldiibacteriota bacterium]|jgi:histidine triad (HIT) family protein